jgi:hypothetical protein
MVKRESKVNKCDYFGTEGVHWGHVCQQSALSMFQTLVTADAGTMPSAFTVHESLKPPLSRDRQLLSCCM